MYRRENREWLKIYASDTGQMRPEYTRKMIEILNGLQAVLNIYQKIDPVTDDQELLKLLDCPFEGGSCWS